MLKKSLYVLFFMMSIYLIFSNDNIVVITEDYPPLNYVERGKLKGPSVDIVREIMKLLNMHNDIIVESWINGYNKIENEGNVALFSTTRTEMRDNKFKWVGPLAEKRYVFFAKKGSQIKVVNLNDAKNYKVAVQLKGVNEEFLISEGFRNLESSLNPIQSYKKLLAGKCDLWYASESTAEGLAYKTKNTSIEIEVIYVVKKSRLYIAFNKKTDSTIIKMWQNAYDKLYESGKVEEIFKNYKMEALYPQNNVD